MALTKPPVVPVWADTGDKIQPADADITTGWPLSNIPPSRQRFNWFFNFAANAVRYLTRRGIPDWAADETYLIGDRVQWTDGKAYVSLANTNINFAPGPNPTKWDVWGLTASAMTAYAPLASPNFSGVPTVPNAAGGTNTTQAANTAFVQAAITSLINGAPGALDTLKELADAMADDANFATTVTNALALKAPLASPALTGTPTAPTASNGTNTTQLATTAFVQAALSGLTVQYVAASQGVNKGVWLVDTTAGPVTLSLPLGPNLGDSLEFIDAAGTWSPNNLTVGRNGQTIMGIAEDLVCNIRGEIFRIWFNGTTWRIE